MLSEAGGKRDWKCSYPQVELSHSARRQRGRGERAVTSFRWSVLPQDADRLCMQKLARSPSGSCQDRGVCRKTCSQTGSSAGRKQPAVSRIEVVTYEAFSHLFINLADTPRLPYSSREGKPCTWPYPNFYSPGTLPQGLTVLTSSLFYFFLLCVWYWVWNPGPCTC